MAVFLWIMVVLSALEVIGTMRWALKGEVPKRTRAGMIFNAAVMMTLGGWAFWLLARGHG